MCDPSESHPEPLRFGYHGDCGQPMKTLRGEEKMKGCFESVASHYPYPHPSDPKFIAAHLIPDNDDRDNDKIYFFFTEKVSEAGDREGAIQTRVGRVCAVRQRHAQTQTQTDRHTETDGEGKGSGVRGKYLF